MSQHMWPRASPCPASCHLIYAAYRRNIRSLLLVAMPRLNYTLSNIHRKGWLLTYRATAITPPRNLSRASVENVEQEHRPKGLGCVGHRLLVITAKQPQQLDVR